MRILHLDELERTEVLASSVRACSNADIRNLYNYLRTNGNRPNMVELPNGDIRIQYFRKECAQDENS